MSDKKVNVTITGACRASGKDLLNGKVYALPAGDAQAIVSAGRGVYGGTLKKKAAPKGGDK